MLVEHFATIRLGTCRYPETLSMLLQERGYKPLRVRTGDIVNAPEETEVDVVACMQLNLDAALDAPRYIELTAAAQRAGFRLCPAETHLQLLLQCEDALLRLSERYYHGLVTVMSAAIPDGDQSPYVMRFRAYDGRVVMEPHWFWHYKDSRWGPGPILLIKPRI